MAERAAFVVSAVVIAAGLSCATAADRPKNCCGPGCRDESNSVNSFYDEGYFAWQRQHGLVKAKQQDWARFVNAKPSDTVVDFGAGTGAILDSMTGRVGRTVAVEFNDHARRYMAEHSPQIRSYKYPELLPDRSVDVLFSTSVIEHVECPITELRELRRKVVPGGRVVIGIKNEGVELWRDWSSANRDNHLYTWNSMLLGNTLRAAGFVVDHISVSGRNPSQVEASILDKRFGRAGHTFQYVYAFGHRPKLRQETWPQNGTARVLFKTKQSMLKKKKKSAKD